MPHPLFDRHQKTLQSALNAIHERGYWSAYPEVPSGKIYGETAKDEGLAGFQNRLNKPFEFDGPRANGKTVGEEVSPYGFKLGITYAQTELEELIMGGQRAMESWKRADLQTRVGVCLEILHRLNQRSFELAFAVMHTTGQGFMMAFQAGGPHAQDRGLEAVAYAYDQMSRVPEQVAWQKQIGKAEIVRVQKSYRIVPRGVAAVIGCSTFPTWNSYPGLFASLATGNAVIVKSHPGAVLPLAITVQIAREVLREEGFDPNLIALAPDTKRDPITKELVTHPQVKIVDYTGSSEFGTWIEQNATQAAVFTEKAGVNSVIIDGVDDLRAMANNLAFTLSLYSGQMCTASQNIFIPRGGVAAGGEHKSFDEVAGAIVGAVDWLLGDPKRAAEILGAIQNDQTARRVDDAAGEGEVLRAPSAPANPAFPEARMRGPLIVRGDAAKPKLFMREMFGPIAYIISTDDTRQSIELASRCARELGAITWSAYATDPAALEAVQEAAADAGVMLSCNLTGQVFVNQSAAFSDYHVSGCNPSGNATLTDAAFVTPRFRVVQSRMPIAAPPAAADVKSAVAAASV